MASISDAVAYLHHEPGDQYREILRKLLNIKLYEGESKISDRPVDTYVSAWYGGQIVGAARLSPADPAMVADSGLDSILEDCGYSIDHVAAMRGIAVKGPYRRQGIGTNLVMEREAMTDKPVRFSLIREASFGIYKSLDYVDLGQEIKDGKPTGRKYVFKIEGMSGAELEALVSSYR